MTGKVLIRGLIYDGLKSPKMGEVIVEGGVVRRIKGGNSEEYLLEVNGKVFSKGERLLLTPTFYDNHVHPLGFLSGGRAATLPSTPRGRKVWNRKEFVEWLKRGLKRGSPLVVLSLEEDMFAEGEIPTGEDLRREGVREPVLLVRVCGHVGYATEEALGYLEGREGDYSQGQVSWSDGKIVEDALTVLREEMILRGRLQTLKKYGEHMLSLGISHALAMVSMNEYERYLKMEPPRPFKLYFAPLLRDFLRRTSRLKFDERVELLKKLKRSSLPLVGLKYIGDGSIGARTAFLRDEYEDTKGRGLDLMNRKEVLLGLRLAYYSGVTFFTHAIGDGAIEKALGLYEEFLDREGLTPEEGKRLSLMRIEHAELIPEDLRMRAKELRMPLAVQPNFIHRWQRPGGLYERALGRERLKEMNPLRSLVEAGIVLFFSSDSMPEGPLYGMRGAVNHPVPGENLPAELAIRFYQRGPLPHLRGSYLRMSVWEGNPASFTVILPGGRVLATVRGPKVYVGEGGAKGL